MKNNRVVWAEASVVKMIDQNALPFQYEIVSLKSYDETCKAIVRMTTRGAGSIGAAAGFAMMQAAFEATDKDRTTFLAAAKKKIENTRPTARDLFAAVEKVYQKALISNVEAEIEAHRIADEIANAGRQIGIFGNELIKNNDKILTHCNAGRLALVDFGSALAPVYEAFSQEKNIFVYADETRPRSQGARLTAWELHETGVPHAVIPDNAAAWYMSLGKIDMVIVGADRIAANGDTANKIGTLEKAICAKNYNIPFYVAAPRSTFDFSCTEGSQISIEERSAGEVLYQTGPDEKGNLHTIRVVSPGSNAENPAFDVTPAHLITAFITEHGIFKPGDIGKLINFLF